MKKILTGAIAAIALVGVASPAAAQTNVVEYAGIPFVGTINGSSLNGGGELSLALGIGTRYTANTTSSANVGTVSNVDVAFTLKGTVSKDCSFYAGNNASATTLNFGTIGIQAGNNVNVSDAFEMVGPAAAVVTSATAGCNFSNTVKIEKSNAGGMLNTATNLSYDSNQFQANIPYRVDAAWVGVPGGAGPVAGTPQSLNVSTTAVSNTNAQGAWRSGMVLTFTAPVAAKALVAGQYEGVTHLTLTAAL